MIFNIPVFYIPTYPYINIYNTDSMNMQRIDSMCMLERNFTKESKDFIKPQNINYGVLTFRYNNFTHFEKQFKQEGKYTFNIGDNIQTIAIRNLYKNWE